MKAAVAAHVLSARARELREVFDATFGRPPPPPPPETAALLLVRAGGELIAVKRADMTGFVRAESFAPAPARSAAFLGFAGLRGEIFPVWSLAGLLGRTVPPMGGWLVLAAASDGAPCAFACEAFERLVFAPAADLTAPAPHETRREHVQALLPWAGALVPVVNLTAVLAEIHKRTPTSPTKTPPP